MGRRLLFILGLAAAAYGGWLVHHEEAINNFCNLQSIDPKRGFVFSPQCLNIVWPYSEGFALLILGAILVVAALIWSRRAMAGERQYLRDRRAGKFNRENDHLNSYNLRPQSPDARMTYDQRQPHHDAREVE